MRPTFLQFRSPKEKTPDPYHPTITYNGKSLEYVKAKSPSFSKAKRFKEYEADAKKTGHIVGPGSYSNNSLKKIKGGCLYKPLYGVRGNIKNCFYVGQLLVINSPDKKLKKTDTNLNKFQSRPLSATNSTFLSKPRTFSPGRTSSPNRISDYSYNSAAKYPKLASLD